jgi:hypothetical protein
MAICHLNMPFLCKNQCPCPLATADLIGVYFYNRQHLANYYQKSTYNWIYPCANILTEILFISQIGKADQKKLCFAEFFWVCLTSPLHIEYSMRQYIGVVITERSIFDLALCIVKEIA